MSRLQLFNAHELRALYWLKWLLVVLGIVLVGVVLFAFPRELSWSAIGVTVNALSVALVTAIGAFLVGSLLGVLYGMPVEKSSASAEQKAPNGPDSAASSNDSQANLAEDSRFRQSTRLSEIADWLTKIIIGLGLVEMAKISSKVSALADFIGKGLGNSSGSNAFALGILICSFVGGFLLGYIWSDMFLPRMLSGVYLGLSEKVRDLAKGLEQVRESVKEPDLEAIRLSERWLSQPSIDPQNEKKLTEAINQASATARHILFNQAYELDRPDWTREKRMDARVPIYQALVDLDKTGDFHRNRAQLGIALATRTHRNKDSDCESALEALNKAIEVRNTDPGWRNYEFYRAYARIIHSQKQEELDLITGDLDEALKDRSLVERLYEVKWHNGHPNPEPPANRSEYTSEDITKIREWLHKHDQERFHQWNAPDRKKAAAA